MIAVDHPRTRSILQGMVDAGIKLVTIASDVPASPRSTYVGLDNRVAGRTAALLMGRLLRGLAGNIAIVTGSRSYRGHEEREMGFRAVLGEDFPELSVTIAVDINEDGEASYAETIETAQGTAGSARHLLRRRRPLRRGARHARRPSSHANRSSSATT